VCVILIAVEVQTVVTIPKDFDFESLLGFNYHLLCYLSFCVTYFLGHITGRLKTLTHPVCSHYITNYPSAEFV